MERVGGRGRDLALDLVREFGEVAEGERRLRHVDGDHVAHGLAHAQRIEQRELRGVLVDQRSEAVQDVEALAGRHPAPCAGTMSAEAARDGGVDLGCTTGGHVAKRLGRGRVDDREARAAPSLVFAVNEVTGRIAQLGGQAVPLGVALRKGHWRPRESGDRRMRRPACKFNDFGGFAAGRLDSFRATAFPGW